VNRKIERNKVSRIRTRRVDTVPQRHGVTNDKKSVSDKSSKIFRLCWNTRKNIAAKSKKLCQRRKNKTNWALSKILKFVYFQRERAERKEISGGTVRNYTKSIKLFCEMADISISWKKITRGLTRGKKLADDRIPTLPELKKLIDYPDRRIKAHRN